MAVLQYFKTLNPPLLKGKSIDRRNVGDKAIARIPVSPVTMCWLLIPTIPHNIGLQTTIEDLEVLNNELGHQAEYRFQSGNQYINSIDNVEEDREVIDLRDPTSLRLSKGLPGTSQTKQALRATTMLKDKTTNVVVNPARPKGFLLQTPASQSGKAQLPRTPPPKRPRADAPKKSGISSSRCLSGPNFASVKPTLKDQGFPNVPFVSESTSTKTRIADHPQPFHEPRRQSGVFEQPSAKNSALDFIDKAKGVATDTTQAAVKVFPTLVLPKTKVKREQKIKCLRQTGTEIKPVCSWKVTPRDRNIRNRDCKEVAGATENHQKVSSIEFIPRYTRLGVRESCQNLLDESPSNRNGRGIIYAANFHETSEASDVEMTTSRRNSRGPVLPSTSADSWGQQGRYSRNRRKHMFYNDAEQGFEGDVEMYTGEDDFGLDAQDTEDSCVTGVNPLAFSPKDLDADSDGDSAAILRGQTEKPRESSQMGSGSEGHAPANVKGDRMTLSTKKRPPRQSTGKRHTPIVEGPNSRSFLQGHRRVSLLDGPPEDISNLSEDELCSPQYIIGCDASGQRTISKSKGYKKKVDTTGVRKQEVGGRAYGA